MMNQSAGKDAWSNPRPTRTSEFLRDFAGTLTGERTSVGDMVAGLGDRGLGVLMAIFALPNILPSTVPFGNMATGIPPLIFAIQLTMGGHHLILPGFIERKTMSTRSLKVLAPRIASVLSWFERLLKPRLSWVTGGGAERVMGAIAIFLALVSTVPIPFAHQLPSLGLLLIGLGLIERDGLAMLIGAAIGVAGTILLGLALFGLAHGLGFLFHHRHLHL
ncbi:MAG TPA: exopolysaccharide biosynthesis protein [Micropepsaceae bacterium]|nr:exopolysaccharide biosynthesis protein [Micropepsaceae bacterium]